MKILQSLSLSLFCIQFTLIFDIKSESSKICNIERLINVNTKIEYQIDTFSYTYNKNNIETIKVQKRKK